jgi:hypothetical protein
MSDPCQRFYDDRPDLADAACTVEVLRQWLTTGSPDRAPHFLRRTPRPARCAAAATLPAMLTDAVRHLRQRAADSPEHLSGPYASELPRLAREALTTLPSRIRVACDVLRVPPAVATSLMREHALDQPTILA